MPHSDTHSADGSDTLTRATRSLELLEPATVHELQDIVAAANGTIDPVRVAGSGTWLGAGRPVTATRVLATSKIGGITEYVPGDLVLTARAGTTLAEIADATGKHHQWFACDAPGAPDSTIGATVATATSGPLSTGFGRVRDLVLGLTAVTGDALLISVGGRVVKNVAGFDLVRLLTGSWGTLGVITEVSLRLHARPQVDETVCVSLAPGALPQQFAALRALHGTPMAMQLLSPSLAAYVLESPAQHPLLLVRLGGNARRVAAQRAALGTIGAVQEVSGSVWTRLQLATGNAPIHFRVSDAASRVAMRFAQLEQLLSAAGRRAQLMVSLHSGVIHVDMGDGQPIGDLLAEIRATGATVVASVLPESDWNQLPSPLSEPIAANIRERFDPKHVLNRFILGNLT